MALGFAGCEGGRATAVTGADEQALSCLSPAGVSDAPDAGGAGCFRMPSFQICDPTSCQNACTGATFPLSCTGAAQFGSIPDPEPSLGCTVVPIPTPSDVLFYCCPCAK